jgi:CRP/FNR family transcriptional regulator, cyclic AMP receptor protein
MSELDPILALADAGFAPQTLRVKKGQIIYSQGDAADCLFYLQSGYLRLTVVGKKGREATLTLVHPGDFTGIAALESAVGLRATSAIALTECMLVRIERAEMLRLLHEEQHFSYCFIKFLVSRNVRTAENLVDQLFNDCEKRLARTLLSMAGLARSGEAEGLLPRISQQMLAEMIGSSRPRVNFFLNRFRKLGLIEYGGRIKVYESLSSVLVA